MIEEEEHVVEVVLIVEMGNSGGGRFSSNSNRDSNFGNNNFKNRQPGERLRKPRWDMSTLQPFRKDFISHILMLQLEVHM